MINVAIVHHQPIFLLGLKKALLHHGLVRVCNTYGNKGFLLNGLAGYKPDIILFGAQNLSQEDYHFAKQVMSCYNGINILVLSDSENISAIKKMLKYCLGYLLTDSNEDTITKAVVDIWQGQQVIDKRLQMPLVSNILSLSKAR